jgi:competence protein ComEC
LDLDHYGGFASLIFNDKIKEIYRPMPDSSDKSKRLEKFLIEKKIKTDFYTTSFLNIGNAKVYFLNDPFSLSYSKFSSNNKSGIMKIVYGKTSILFVGDCEFPEEYYLSRNFADMLDSDVLKVGHHGSPTGSSKTFLDLVTPKISLISAGVKNKFNHPAESVISSLNAMRSKILRTDYDGAVLLQSDGENIKVVNWK